MKKSGFLLIITLIALAAMSLGCSRAVPVNLRVTGTGAMNAVPGEPVPPPPPPPAPVAAPSTAWADREIIATGYGAQPEQAASPAQANLMAKRAALVDAYRNLSEAVMGVQVDSQTTVRNFVTENDEIRTRVDSFINGAEKISETQIEDGSWEVKVRMNLQPLGNVIMPPPPDAPAPVISRPASIPSPAPAQARLMARRAAILDAHRQMLEQLKGVYITSSTTVEDFIARDDRIRSRVEGIIRGARVIDERTSSDGVYEVEMELVHPDISQVVR